MEKDFNVKITVRNARLLSAIRDKWESAAAFCRGTGISYGSLNALVGMRDCPILQNGEWKEVARDVAAALGKYPDEIWPQHIKELKAKKSTAEIEINGAELGALAKPNSFETRRLLAKWSDGISPRKAKALALFAEGETLETIGIELNVGRERARQIIAGAARDVRKIAKRDGVRCISDIV